MRELEGVRALLEEAVDDPPRMARSLPAGKAVACLVNAVDRERREGGDDEPRARRAAGGL